MKHRGAVAEKRKRASAQQSVIIRKIIRLEERVWKVAQERDAVRFAELVPADAVMIFRSGIVRPAGISSDDEKANHLPL